MMGKDEEQVQQILDIFFRWKGSKLSLTVKDPVTIDDLTKTMESVFKWRESKLPLTAKDFVIIEDIDPEKTHAFHLKPDSNGKKITDFIKACGLKYVYIVGNLETTLIPNDFLFGCEKLKEVHYVLPGVINAGSSWMSDCTSLTSISFEGLQALTTVGDHWMCNCKSLTSLSFEGLGALTTVGSNWIYHCVSLTSVSFEGLQALTTVGASWMAHCESLTSVSFEGLQALETVVKDSQ